MRTPDTLPLLSSPTELPKVEPEVHFHIQTSLASPACQFGAKPQTHSLQKAPPTLYKMAEQSTSAKAINGLTAREQEILVAALSKCLKSGDIQVSPLIPPHSHLSYSWYCIVS
jgi:hypothetical protein